MSNICTINNRACAKGSTLLKLKDYLNPYDLPDRTIRIQSLRALSTDDFTIPGEYANMTLVDSVQHIYDFTRTSWMEFFARGFVFNHPESWLVRVIGANASSVGNMSRMFMECTSLQDIAIFDTSSLKYMNQMFQGCTNLSYIPLFNVNKVEEASWAFKNCINVEQGILSMYNALSTNGHIQYYNEAFYSCGSNTVQGAAELAQIPSDWK